MLFLAILQYAILASTFTIAKVAVRYADPLFLIGVRMVLAAPIMIFIHRWQKNNTIKIKKEDLFTFLMVGIFHIFIPFVGEFWALQFVSSAKAALTYSLTPFIAALLSYFLLKRGISPKQSLGLIIGLMGLLPLLISKDELSFGAELLFISLPEAVLLFVVSSACYAWFLVTKLMDKGYGISFINGTAMLIGGVMSLALWALVSDGQTPLKGEFAPFLFWTLLMILVANVVSYNFYGWLLKHLSITLMSAIGFLCPIFATLYGFLFLHEDLGIWHFIALFMVGSGIWLFYREEVYKLHLVNS